VEDPSGCDACGATALEQDPDVLDTWFSSQLWPFSTLGWPEQTDDLRFFFPTSALVTGYDILYLWVARMIMSALFLVDDVPFHPVVIHGLVRDPQGRKMSKSLGNVIDPLDAIAKSGADALRFGLAYQATDAQNIPFGEEHIEAGRRFANKIWNAARLVLSARDGRTGAPDLPEAGQWSVVDRWLLSRHQACLEEVDRSLDGYRFSEAVRALHHFFWSEFCDWGLEAMKVRLYEGSPEQRGDAAEVLSWVLERTLRLLHPVMPFVTEEVWQRFGAGDSIMVAPWPGGDPQHRDTKAEAEFGSAMAVVGAVRRFRKAHGLKDSISLPIHIQPLDPTGAEVLRSLRPEIERLGGISALEVVEERTEGEGFARLSASEAGEVLIPMGGLFDLDVERARLAKRVADLERSVSQSEGKLSNDGFVAKAPEDVGEKERRKLASLKAELVEAAAQLEDLG